MESNWWYEDEEDEGIRWFEIQEDEFRDVCLDFELMFVELGLSGERLDMDDMIDRWLNSVSRLN